MKPCKLMFAEFEKKFLNFDYDFYDEVIKDREKNKEGHYKASGLIIEIARLSGAFVSEPIRSTLDETQAAFCAFAGWSVSYEGILKSKNYRKIDRIIKENAKYTQPALREMGAKISIEDVGQVIFCCAMLREKFYSQFDYNMVGFQLKTVDGEETFEVAYSYKPT